MLTNSPSILAQTDLLPSSYGSAFVKTTSIMDQYHPMVGGMGAVIVHENIALGGFGNALLGHPSFEENLQDGAEEVYLKLGYGGLFAEYFLVRSSSWQCSIPLKLAYGAAGLYQQENDERVERIGLLVVEPEFHIDLRLGKHLAIGLQASYRAAFADNPLFLDEQQLRGFNLGVGLKFISR